MLFELNSVIKHSSPGPQPFFIYDSTWVFMIQVFIIFSVWSVEKVLKENLVVSSGLLSLSWTAILELYREFSEIEHIRFRAYQKPNYTVIIAIVTSPTFTKHYLQEEKELVSASSLPFFHFLCTKSKSELSIHKAVVTTLFGSLLDQLSNLKIQEKLVAEAERLSQKEEAAFKNQRLYGERAYRRMVELLDIVDYYSKGYKDYVTKGTSS